MLLTKTYLVTKNSNSFTYMAVWLTDCAAYIGSKKNICFCLASRVFDSWKYEYSQKVCEWYLIGTVWIVEKESNLYVIVSWQMQSKSISKTHGENNKMIFQICATKRLLFLGTSAIAEVTFIFEINANVFLKWLKNDVIFMIIIF